MLKGYMIITRHCVDSNCNLFYSMVNFKRYSALHTADVVAGIIKDFNLNWEIKNSTRSIKTANAVDMVVRMYRLCVKLKNIAPGLVVEWRCLHVHCKHRTVNLADRKCKVEVHEKIIKIWQLVAALRSSVKRREEINLNTNRTRTANSQNYILTQDGL